MSTLATAFDRDELAKWYAKRHLDIDSGIVAIHYLPANAPAREIRFLEVNDQISEMTDPKPIDFGIDVGGEDPHALYVLDVTPAQWDAIQSGALPLPEGWSLDNRTTIRK